MPALRNFVLTLGLLSASPSLACSTVDDIVRTAEQAQARATVISESGALSRALSFMLGNADDVQPADTLVVIEQGLKAEIVLMERGCATMRALSNRDLVLELLRRADGESGGELI